MSEQYPDEPVDDLHALLKVAQAAIVVSPTVDDAAWLHYEETDYDVPYSEVFTRQGMWRVATDINPPELAKHIVTFDPPTVERLLRELIWRREEWEALPDGK